jgi:polar amino acid transport system substrate-binding protein
MRFLIIFLFCINLFANDKVSIQLLWKHQFEFAGIYVAKEKGFYKEQNLDVDIKEFDFNVDISKDVILGKTTFGIGYPSVILNGNDIVLMSAFFQSSPHAIATTNMNIKNVKNFKNKAIMINNDAISTIAFRG